MKKSVPILLLALSLAQAAPAFGADLERTLKNQYEKHVLGLRNPIQQTHQEFDSNGKPLYQISQERWTVYGGLYVRKLSLRSDRLRVEGPWVALGANKNERKPGVISLGKEIGVEVRLDHPPSADEVLAILDHIFFLDDPDHSHCIPEFRRSDFAATNETLHKMGK